MVKLNVYIDIDIWVIQYTLIVHWFEFWWQVLFDEDNQKNPEKIAVSKGQNLQNLENTKKDNEELDVEIQKIQNKYNEINNSINLAQEKFTVLRENRARLEATLEGIDQRKMDLVYLIKNELKIENINLSYQKY